MVRHSLRFLQEAEMVSDVASWKYHSLFLALSCRKTDKCRTVGTKMSNKCKKRCQNTRQYTKHISDPDLLLNFCGCFSLITWNWCAIDASCWRNHWNYWHEHNTPAHYRKRVPPFIEPNASTSIKRKLKGTHHTNREIVVDDVIRHWVALVCHIRRKDLQTPAIHLYQCTLLNLLHDFCQISAFISCLIQHVWE